jgi:carbon monoxide dehydrogenase subunit G
MALEIAKTFTIDAPRAAVWAFLTDPHRVARCLPGAAITEKVDDQTYAGTITIKVGPVTASYRGKVRFESLDEAAGTADIVASGQDVKGKGGADMRMHSQLTETAPGRTEVASTSAVNVTGILAQMGARMIQDVSDQMLGRFTQAMQAELATSRTSTPAPPGAAEITLPPAASPAPARPPAPPPPPVEALDAVALGKDVAARMAGRAVRRPAFWIVLGAVALGIYWLLRR